METLVEELAIGLHVKRLQFPKTVIFCRKYTDWAEIYMHLHCKMGKEFTEPTSYPNLQQFRLVDMYTRVSKVYMKEKIIPSFCSKRTHLHVIIATTASGTGINCHQVK